MLYKLVLPLLVCATLSFSQSTSLPTKETLHYNIEWRLFNAGKARVEITNTPPPRPGYQTNLHLESTGIVSKLFKVEDDYSVNMNSNYCAQSLQMTTHEGTRLRDTRITFDSEARKASYLERDRAKNNAVVLSQEIDIPPCVHDVVGGLFFIRTLNLEPGQSTQIPVSDGKKSLMVKVEAQAREDVKTPEGTFKTIRYEIYLFNGVLYKRSAHVNVWVSDDRRRLPVQIRVRMTITIGTINLLLEKARVIKAVFLLAAVSQCAAAVELHIQFGALERMLTEQVFSQEGRRYVHGSKTTKCNFAYLEKPQVQGRGSLLLIKAHFTGRSALNFAGQCVGLGDAFDVVITALPVYKNGAIGLQEVKVASGGKSGYYIRKVCEAMQASLSKDFTYPLQAESQKLLEAPAAQPGYKREVRKFNVPDIRVSSDALVLQVDFELTVK